MEVATVRYGRIHLLKDVEGSSSTRYGMFQLSEMLKFLTLQNVEGSISLRCGRFSLSKMQNVPAPWEPEDSHSPRCGRFHIFEMWKVPCLPERTSCSSPECRRLQLSKMQTIFPLSKIWIITAFQEMEAPNSLTLRVAGIRLQGRVQGTASETSQRNLIHLPSLNTVLPWKWHPT